MYDYVLSGGYGERAPLWLRHCQRTSFKNIFFAQSNVPLYNGDWPGAGFGIVCNRT